TDINDNEQMSFAVYPTIFEDALMLNYTSTDGNDVTFNMYDTHGRFVASKKFAAPTPGGYAESWDVSSLQLPAGLYLIECVSGDQRGSVKVMKQ
ncbi:MAG TPA: T9SS type A sorting domain-containing protein, partial [Chitinophagales bacterium]|nr:T9SS type A sorting domain-containing protein [Chitinophagales bacterium]